MKKMDCRALLEEEIAEICLKNGIEKFRAGQIFNWVQGKGIHNWEEMTNIAKEDKEKLSSVLYVQPLEIIREQCSKDGTLKFLYRLADGNTIETVLMNYSQSSSKERNTLCLSTQVGCPVGCSFCATGQSGFERNLSVGEITGQVLDIFNLMRQRDKDFKITNLVFMGMGEPFLNYDAVMKAVTLFNRKNGLNIGMRKMTISTSGIAPKIIQLSHDNPQVGLAISLHSARDEIRDTLVPLNKKYPLAALMEACKYYIRKTGRRVTFEMALQNKTTNRSEAEALVRLLKGMLVHVNLIPVNPVADCNLQKPAKEKLAMFKQILESAGIPVTVREEKGSDIHAACGQLRQRLESEQHESFN